MSHYIVTLPGVGDFMRGSILCSVPELMDDDEAYEISSIEGILPSHYEDGDTCGLNPIKRLKIQGTGMTMLEMILPPSLQDSIDRIHCHRSTTSRSSLHFIDQDIRPSQILSRCLPLRSTTSILPNSLLPSTLIILKFLQLRTIHKLGHIIRLLFLEAKPETFMAVIFVIGLVLVILHLDEIAINGVWCEGQRDKSVEGCDFGDVFCFP